MHDTDWTGVRHGCATWMHDAGGTDYTDLPRGWEVARGLGPFESVLSSLGFSGAEHGVSGKHPVDVHMFKAGVLQPFELLKQR